jgi:hypothetical protein
MMRQDFYQTLKLLRMGHTETFIPDRRSADQSVYVNTPRRTAFIEANTVQCSVEEIRNDHIIPVFVKDNETLVSHVDFIEAAEEVTRTLFRGETILSPDIRVSHPIKGRVPEAKDKLAKDLLPWEKTLYYERMAFAIEIPSIQTEVAGNRLCLTLGGVKSYAEDNLYSRTQCDQHFKLFIGFQNKVCTNLCVFSDGYVDGVKVRSVGMLKAATHELLSRYNEEKQLTKMQQWANYALTEEQFAQLVGKCRMFQYLPTDVRKTVLTP